MAAPEATVALAEDQTQAQCVLRETLIIAAGDDAHRNEHWKYQEQQSDAKRRTREQRPDGWNEHAAANDEEWHKWYAPEHRGSGTSLEDGILK
jgi:hypothetical protein